MSVGEAVAIEERSLCYQVCDGGASLRRDERLPGFDYLTLADHVSPSPLLGDAAERSRVLLEPLECRSDKLRSQLVVVIEVADEIALSVFDS